MRPEELTNIPLEVEKLFYELQDRIMSDVVRRIQKTGEITSTADYQLNRYEIIGNSTEFIESEIKRLTGMTDVELWKIYDEVVDKEYTRNASLYEQVNRNFTPPEDNAWLNMIGNAVMAQTTGEVLNISRSMGFSLDYGNGKKVFTPLSEYYQKYLDNACMDIASGAFDYNSVLRRVVKQMTSSGLQYVDYASGYRSRAPVAARRAVMTGVHQLSNRINERVANELGTDDYEVTAHYGARLSHSYWQGGVYSYKELQTVCGLGSVTGLCGANCRHSYYPFVKGISAPSYTQEELETMRLKDAEIHTFKGKGYNAYEASQKQRHYETTMRAQRARVKHLKDGKTDQDDILAAQTRYLQTLHEYQQFSRTMKIPTQMERVYMDGLGRIAPGISSKAFQNTAKNGIIKNKKVLENKTYHSAIKAEEKKICKDRIETAILFDTHGNIVFRESSNASNYVKFSEEQLHKMKDATLTHNHPSNSTFSVEDVNLFVSHDLKAIRAAGEKKTYQLSKYGKISQNESIIKDYKKAQADNKKITDVTYQKISKQLENGDISYSEYNEKIQNLNSELNRLNSEWLKSNSRNYGYKYSVIERR